MTSTESPRLSVSIQPNTETPPPHEFPSPSSSFLPPPVIGGEEFALPTPSNLRSRGPGIKTIERVINDAESNGVDTPTVRDGFLGKDEKPIELMDDHNHAGETTPAALSSESTASDLIPKRMPLSRHASLASLRSTRVAPESPGTSRRQSRLLQSPGVGSSHSPQQSHPPIPSPSPAALTQMHRPTKSKSRLSVSFTSGSFGIGHGLAAPNQKKKRPKAIVIRDYAFAADGSDNRFEGRGTQVPKASRPSVLNRALRATSTASFGGSGGGSGTDDDDDDELRDDGWGVDALNAGAVGRLSWSSSLNNSHSAADGEFPGHTDFARNFVSDDDDDDDDDDTNDELDIDPLAEEEPDLPPGIYLALYAFSPLSPSECALEPGTEVRVVGLAGGGGGWAVIERASTDTESGLLHGLVPASYLELVTLEELEQSEDDFR